VIRVVQYRRRMELGKKMDFRIYLFNNHRRIIAFEDLKAMTKVDALELGEALYEACSDKFGGFELWQGDRRVAQRFGEPCESITVEMLNERRQRSAAEVEERLRDSFQTVAESQKLIKRLANLDALLD
jgi:hypothetical protein